MSALPAYDALVLAGGAGRRLGGVDKCALPVGGRPILERVLDAVHDAGTVVVVGPPRPVARPVVWARERPPGGGPAAGIAAGLEHVTADLVAVLAGDLPFLTAATVAELRRLATADGGAVLVDDEGQEQWLVGMWRAPVLRGLHLGPGVSLRSTLGSLRPFRLFDPGGGDRPPPWLDCDTPDDLQTARGLT